jgi:Ca2+-binding RTX toxin-like protein
MKTVLGFVCALTGLMTSSSLLLVSGCGSNSDQKGEQTSESGGASAAGASHGSVEAAEGGAPSAHGGTGSGETGPESPGTGAQPHVDPGGPVDPPDPGELGAAGSGADSPDFDGIDLSELPTSAPTGCVGGFDPDTGGLAIALGEDVTVAHVSVHAGVVQVNGVDCEGPGGDAAKAAQVLKLEIAGSAGDDELYVDLSDELFSGCFSEKGAISIDLGKGRDTVVILGTSGRDSFHAGSDMSRQVFDLDGDDRPDLAISGSPAVVVSTGAKSDEVSGDGAALGTDPVTIPLSIYGGGADDRLVGGSAADALFGGIGNDWFDAGKAPAGADAFDGGDGVDTIDFSARTAPLVITLAGGADDGEKDELADVKPTIENVYGGQAKNQITGADGPNTIWGGPDADTLDGGAGDDTIAASKGDDSVKGGAGNDYLYGEDGDDELQGGADDDLLDGGEGKNTLDGGPSDGDICIATKADKVAACEL